MAKDLSSHPRRNLADNTTLNLTIRLATMQARTSVNNDWNRGEVVVANNEDSEGSNRENSPRERILAIVQEALALCDDEEFSDEDDEDDEDDFSEPED